MYDPSTVESWGLPPLACIVMERGNSNLSEWLQCHLRVLDHMDQRNILFKICKAVQYLHEHGIVHRCAMPLQGTFSSVNAISTYVMVSWDILCSCDIYVVECFRDLMIFTFWKGSEAREHRDLQRHTIMETD